MKKIIQTIKAVVLIFAVTGMVLSCRNEPNPVKPKIESITFVEDSKTLRIGERTTIGVTVSPKEALHSEKIQYSGSSPGVIEIDEENSSNEGVVFEGVGAGSMVILAKANGVVGYVDITVEGNVEYGVPYITVTNSVVEIPFGMRKSVVATLQEGTVLDNSGFTFLNENDSVVLMETANNVAVLEGMRSGSSRITVSHPKAQYSVDILAFVLMDGETAKYITAENNVVYMDLNGEDQVFYITLVGVEDSHINQTVYEVVEGNNVAQVIGGGEYCTIRAKNTGIAKVRVTNQAVEYPFEFQVVVRNDEEVKYIDVSDNLVIIEGMDIKSVSATVTGNVPVDYVDKFSYNVSEEDIINVIHTNDLFTLRGIKNGMVVLTISNKYCDFSREVLVITQLQGPNIINNENYITTSQNVIQMELGGSNALLKMTLVGGIEADRNNFEWVVEDSGIIEANTSMGRVKYARSVIDYVDQSSFEAEAVITAKKVGSTVIRVINPKAKNESTVLVKVYPRGTFSDAAIVLGGPSIIKIKTGDSKDIYTPVMEGNSTKTGVTNWSIEDGSVAQVNGAGLYGAIVGRKSGVTRLKVSGDNIVKPFEAVVVVYNDHEEDSIKYIYSESLNYRIYTGQTVNITIYHPNIQDNQFQMSVINTNRNALYFKYNGNRIIVNGLEPGSGELVISVNEANTLRIFIMVESEKIDIEHPYILSGDNFAGTYVGNTIHYTVSMAGAGEVELSKIQWTIEDSSVAEIVSASGNEVRIKGRKEGQTILRVGHLKSTNSKEVVVYVVKTQEEMKNKIVLGLEKLNYVMSVYESLFIRLVTNANETQKPGIRWSIDHADMVDIDSNYDTGIITALNTGNCRITVYMEDGSHVMPLVLFITIKEAFAYETTIGLPSSVVVVAGSSKVIVPNVSGTTLQENDIFYDIENKNIISIVNNVNEVTVNGLAVGQTYINVSGERFGFFKKILVICVASEDDLDNLYYFTVEKSMYRIKKDDEIKISLMFGENGFPQAQKAQIEWQGVSNPGIVLVNGNGASANIVGKNEGVAKIRVYSPVAVMAVEIIIEVSKSGFGSEEYHFIYASINKMVKNDVINIPISIYKDNKVVNEGYSLIEASCENAHIADAEMVGNVLRVSGKSAGNTVVTLRHSLIREDARIMIVVYEVMPEADEFMVFIPKTHWLLSLDESKTVSIQTSNNGSILTTGILWKNNNSDIISVESMEGTGRTQAVVKGIKSGNATIRIEFEGNYVDTIYISVAEGMERENLDIATESIIVLSMEEEVYITRIVNNGGVIYPSWEVLDDSIARIEPNGNWSYVYPESVGVTEIEVRHYGTVRYIVVVVCQTKEEKYEITALNSETRFHKIAKSDTVIINPYYKVKKPAVESRLTKVYDNNVLDIKLSGGKFEITGKNVGIEQVVISNDKSVNEVTLTFEVDEKVTGNVIGNIRQVYLTTNQNVVIISPNEQNVLINVNVVGEYNGNESDFAWFKNNNNIEMESLGNYAIINARSATGETDISVANRHCINTLEIKIIIGEKYTEEETKEPYVYVQRSLYEMNVGDPALNIPYEVKNVQNVDVDKIYIVYNNDIMQINKTKNGLIITPNKKGSVVIDVGYEGSSHSTKLYVIINEIIENSAVYLTTSMNYVILGKSTVRAVDVKLVNYIELNSSNIRWSSKNNDIAYVIGSGHTVQIYGVKEGITTITAKHDLAYNDLDIVVKVLGEGKTGEVCYLTTGENVIETYIGTVSNSIVVSKVGGKTPELRTTWTVDDPTIVSILGEGDIGYYTPRKEGVAKITVSDIEAGEINIVFIVRKVKEGTQYITANESIIQIKPNSTNNVIGVNLIGGEERDNVDFKWEIFSQLPSDIEAAQNGGGVIDLFAMGNRASVAGIFTGIARIRVSHPKANDRIFIVVQVSDFDKLSFMQDSVYLVEGDMTFVSLEVPNYENMADKIDFMSDNPAVCTIMGGRDIVWISANAEGNAVITASIKGTGLSTRVTVNVLKEKDIEALDIVTSRIIYILSPRETPFVIDANLTGIGVQDRWNDELKWTVNQGTGGKKVIDIYPTTGIGRSIQVVVNNREYKNPENAIITISSSYTNRVRQIFIQVVEDSNMLTIDKSSIKLSTNEIVELSCNIIGGNSKDYEELLWIASKSKSDPLTEVVKVMGKGKSVQIYAVNDGICTVEVCYRGIWKTCNVEVESAIYFEFGYKTVVLYPGQREVGNKLFAVKYTVRPNTEHITWLSNDSQDNPVCIVNYDEVNREVLLDPKREGSFQITGSVRGRLGKLNVVVKNSYTIRLSDYHVATTPNSAVKELTYIITPGTAVLKVSDIAEITKDGIEVTVEVAQSGDNNKSASGKIKIKTTKETSPSLLSTRGYPVTLELYQPNGITKTEVSTEFKIISRFNSGNGRLVPVFEPAFGHWSNLNAREYRLSSLNNAPKGELVKGGYYIPFVSSSVHDGIYNDVYNLEIGDGEEHYILFDRVNKFATIEDIKLLVQNDSEDNGRGMSFEQVSINEYNQSEALDESLAIRISGGKDYILYTMVGLQYDFKVKLNGVANTGRGQVNNEPTDSGTFSISNSNYQSLSSVAANILNQPAVYNSSYPGQPLYNIQYYDGLYDVRQGQIVPSTSSFSLPVNVNLYYETYGKTRTLYRKDNNAVVNKPNSNALVSNVPLYYKHTYYDSGNATETTWSPLLYQKLRNQSFKNGNITLSSVNKELSGVDYGMSSGYMMYAGGIEYKHRYYFPANNIYKFNIFSYYKNNEIVFYNMFNRKIQQWDHDKNPMKDNPDESNWDGSLVSSNAQYYAVKYGREWRIETGQWHNHLNDPDLKDRELSTYTERGASLDISPYTDALNPLRPKNNGWVRNELDGAYNNYNVIERKDLFNWPIGYIVEKHPIYKKATMIREPEKMKNNWDEEGDGRGHFGEYLLFPMPSKNTRDVMKNLGMMRNASLTISYTNAYGKNNTITINVKQNMRQCHAGYTGNDEYFRTNVKSWDDTKVVILDEHFQGAYFDPDNSEDENGKVIVDKNY